MMLAPRPKLSSTQSLHPAGNPEASAEQGALPAWLWRKGLLCSGCLGLRCGVGLATRQLKLRSSLPAPPSPSRAERPHHTIAMTDL